MNTIAAAPHAHDRSSVDRIMLQVCLALLPCTLFGVYTFGWPALLLLLLTIGAALLTEALCLLTLGAPMKRLRDNSALLTGWLLALSLPPWAPWWIGVGGAAFAIAIGKQLYGGIGQNPFNPAMLARVMLLISFPVQMTTWANAGSLFSSTPDLHSALSITFGSAIPDGTTGATTLGYLRTALTQQQSAQAVVDSEFHLLDALFGRPFTSGGRGSLGETSELLVLIGGLWLLYQRIISWHIPVAMLGSLALLSGGAALLNADQHGGLLLHLASGGIMLGAFFIATDMVTSPASPVGKLLFGAGCGAVTFIIRTWAGFPEGIAFAVLFMNAFTPLIDRYLKPRIFGRTTRGEPLPLPRQGASR